MPCSASAPSRTAWECLAKRSKNRSSLGRKARNQRSSIAMSKLQKGRARAARHISVIKQFGQDAMPRRRPNRASSTALWPKKPVRASPGLQRTAEKMGYFTDDSAAERQHAGHENRALDHGHPGTKSGQILLRGDDDEGADHRAKDGTETPDQRHQHDQAGHADLDIRKRGVLNHEHLQRAGEAR